MSLHYSISDFVHPYLRFSSRTLSRHPRTLSCRPREGGDPGCSLFRNQSNNKFLCVFMDSRLRGNDDEGAE